MYANRGVTRYMRSGSSAHDDGRGWSSAQHPYQGRGPRPEQDAPYGPEVSWPSGFRAAEFDSGEYRALVESSYERDEYSHVDPRSGGDRRPGDHPYGDQGHGDQRYGGQRPGGQGASGQGAGGQPGPGRREPGGYQQPQADDYGYGDPGYADPGYDGPGHDVPRGYQPPARQDVRHQLPPAAGPAGHSGPVAPVASGPVYPVTGAQEVYRDPEEPDYGQPRPAPVDPRLVGLRYDELRYDDADLDDRGRSRYDEPLDDEAWYAELRSSGPAQPQRPAGGPNGAGPGPNSPGPNSPGPNAAGPNGVGLNGGRTAGPVPGTAPYGRGTDHPSAGGPGQSAGGRPGPGGPNASARPGGPVARNVAPGNGLGPRLGARPAPAGPVAAKRMPRNPGTGYKAAAAFAPVRPQPAALAPSREQGFLGAPVAQVGVLTPPAGNRYDSDFAGPETAAWSMTQEVDSSEIEVLEEYWGQEETADEYSTLLSDLDDSPRDTGAHPGLARRIGRRRGRSGDRRLWFGLGGVMAVAAAAIFLIIQFEFPSNTGPTHTLAMPSKVGATYLRTTSDDAKLAKLRQQFVQMTHGQATDVLSGAFQAGGVATGGTPEIVMTIDAHLLHDNVATSMTDFLQVYKNAGMVPAGPLGGEAACAESATGNADNVSICAWFDDDSFGVLLSPSMNANALAGELQTFRSSVERVAKS
jgi:hypothetical protein